MGDEDYFRDTDYFQIDHRQRAREDAQRAQRRINLLNEEAAEAEAEVSKLRLALSKIIDAHGSCTCKNSSCIRCIAEIGLGRRSAPKAKKTPSRGPRRRRRGPRYGGKR